jgi:hypothetical protein
VDVADLEASTVGRVLPALVLAARGLARELAVDSGAGRVEPATPPDGHAAPSRAAG